MRSVIRLPLAATAAAALCAAVPSAAPAASFLSARVSTGTGAVSVAFDTGAPATGAPTPLARLALRLPAGFRVAPRAACRAETVLLRPARCPASSRVGGGTARLAAYNSGARAPGGRLDVVADLAAYAGPGGDFLLRAEIGRPFAQVLVYEGRARGRDVVLPLGQGDVAGYELSPAFVRLTLGGPSGAGYIRRSAACPGAGGWVFGALLRYRSFDGLPPDRPLRLRGSAPCRAPA